MHLKFLPHSTGSGVRAVNYLMQERDHKGELRAGVRVLRGNPELVAQQIDSLDFVHRYSSGVIAWHLDDNPTDKQISDVLDSFEEAAFAGLSRDQYSLLAVEHRDADGSVHVHVITPRVDLESGKSLNISPPGWIQYFDPWREYHNQLNGWARVEDPKRARIIQPGPKAYADKARTLDALAVEPDSKQLITDYLVTKIVDGSVTNRHDIRRELTELGEITREGKNYISVKPEGFSKAVRLRGAIYDEKFTAESLRPDSKEAAAGSGRHDRRNPKAAAKARKQLEKNVKRRAERFEKKYPGNPEKHRNSDPERAAADAERAAEKYAAVRANGTQPGMPAGRELVPGSTDQKPSHNAIAAARAERQHDRGSRPGDPGTRRSDRGKDPQRDAAAHTPEGVNDGRATEIANDRVREPLDREAERKRKARSAVDRALDQFIRRADSAVAACRAARRSFDRGIKPLKALTQKLRHFGGLTALRAAQKAKRSFANYGRLWETNRTRIQRAQQLARQQQERAQARDLREVRPLHDHVVQEREPGAMPNPTR